MCLETREQVERKVATAHQIQASQVAADALEELVVGTERRFCGEPAPLDIDAMGRLVDRLALDTHDLVALHPAETDVRQGHIC